MGFFRVRVSIMVRISFWSGKGLTPPGVCVLVDLLTKVLGQLFANSQKYSSCHFRSKITCTRRRIGSYELALRTISIWICLRVTFFQAWKGRWLHCVQKFIKYILFASKGDHVPRVSFSTTILSFCDEVLSLLYTFRNTNITISSEHAVKFTSRSKFRKPKPMQMIFRIDP